METFCTKTMLGEDGKLRLEFPCHLPAGVIEVVVVMTPSKPVPNREFNIHDYVGLGKEIWAGEDAQEYVNRLRDGCAP